MITLIYLCCKLVLAFFFYDKINLIMDRRVGNSWGQAMHTTLVKLVINQVILCGLQFLFSTGYLIIFVLMDILIDFNLYNFKINCSHFLFCLMENYFKSYCSYLLVAFYNIFNIIIFLLANSKIYISYTNINVKSNVYLLLVCI